MAYKSVVMLHRSARVGKLKVPCGGRLKPTPLLAPVPGTAVIFDARLWHGGGPNLSAALRSAVYFRVRFGEGQG